MMIIIFMLGSHYFFLFYTHIFFYIFIFNFLNKLYMYVYINFILVYFSIFLFYVCCVLIRMIARARYFKHVDLSTAVSKYFSIRYVYFIT